MIKGSLMVHLGPIWYHSEPSDVPYSENLLRPISWFGLFLQKNDSSALKGWSLLQTKVCLTFCVVIFRQITYKSCVAEYGKTMIFAFLSSNFLGKNICKKLEYETKIDLLNIAKFQNIFYVVKKQNPEIILFILAFLTT